MCVCILDMKGARTQRNGSGAAYRQNTQKGLLLLRENRILAQMSAECYTHIRGMLLDLICPACLSLRLLLLWIIDGALIILTADQCKTSAHYRASIAEDL